MKTISVVKYDREHSTPQWVDITFYKMNELKLLEKLQSKVTLSITFKNKKYYAYGKYIHIDEEHNGLVNVTLYLIYKE